METNKSHMVFFFVDRSSSRPVDDDDDDEFMRGQTDLYKGLEQTLRERTEGTSVFWGLMLGI